MRSVGVDGWRWWNGGGAVGEGAMILAAAEPSTRGRSDESGAWQPSSVPDGRKLEPA